MTSLYYHCRQISGIILIIMIIAYHADKVSKQTFFLQEIRLFVNRWWVLFYKHIRNVSTYDIFPVTLWIETIEFMPQKKDVTNLMRYDRSFTSLSSSLMAFIAWLEVKGRFLCTEQFYCTFYHLYRLKCTRLHVQTKKKVQKSFLLNLRYI